MGALDECYYNVELQNGVSFGDCIEPETMVIEDSVRVLLQGLGEDINREGLRKTPLRVAKALREGTRGYNQNVKDIVSCALFPEAGLESKVGHAGGAGGLVIVRDLDFFSYCESCLLPFQVKCHIGYIPSGQRVVGLSKLSRVADVFAKRLQDPDRLANEICASLQQSIKPAGVAVVLQCSHIDFPDFQSAIFDPNHQGWVKTSFKSGSGVFNDDKADVWTDFFSLLKFRNLNAGVMNSRGLICKSWKMGSSDPAMLSAVSSIICSLGEDPSRKELLETPTRFLNWLMYFKNCKLDMKLNGFVRNGNFGLSVEEQHICSVVNLPFWSQCEHHLLPFHGVVHIGYYGSNRVINPVGKSLLQSLVHFYGFKLQVQERLTRQIAESVSSVLGEDVMVVVEANHTCMISRGIEKFGSSTATIAVLGKFSTDPTARAKFLQVIPNMS
ncbi:GTP cyclohydrolase 1 [Castilleja foliolosa]|uniref:GTP cyclohydrolase 1 n=1 Tax=Castilleja foliolosa TaxID=1961234 RepID=A0ABD3BF79_9LAMI